MRDDKLVSSIRSILDKLADGERNWIHDQLDGTSMVEKNLEAVDEAVDQALKEISELIDEKIKKIRDEDMKAEIWASNLKELR